MLVANCGECVFAVGEGERERCRRYPQIPLITNYNGVWSAWPPREGDDVWCGEFKPRNGKPWRFPTEEEPEELTNAADWVSHAVKRGKLSGLDRGLLLQGLPSRLDWLRARTREVFRIHKIPVPGWAHEDGCPVQAHKEPRLYPQPPGPPPPDCECETA